MTESKSIIACVSAIKRCNARFRTLKDKDGPGAALLIDRKDRFVDRLASLCTHPEIVGTRGAKAWGPMRVRVGPRRICARCGHCEAPADGEYEKLAKTTTMLPFGKYLEMQGAILKRLGINI